MESERVIAEHIAWKVEQSLEDKKVETFGNTFWDYLGIEEVGE